MNNTFRFSVLALSSPLLFTPLAVQADTIAGLYAGAQIWNMESSGSFGEDGTMQSFNLDDKTKGSFWVALEHPIPVIPNIKIRYNQLDVKGYSDVNNLEFGDYTFTGHASVDAKLDHFDFILYYEILDNDIVSLDLGLNAKYGDFKVKLDGTVEDNQGNSLSQSAEESYNGVIPLGYVAAEIGLPFTGLGVYGEVNWIGYDDHHVHDIQGGIFWNMIETLAIDATVQFGYRDIKFDIEDLSGIYADAEFKGAYAGLQLHF
ncbi:TIGR04219 family outer membrane beta-barrel protein [Psychromonas sp. MME2]|uniref:TIGR04219 family outer membrane beta-barrel protein n=1 Tax=unclassified Psychromonas TaxID=2614957 RepID=UPI00339C462C